MRVCKLISMILATAVVLVVVETARAQTAGFNVINSTFNADAWASAYTGDVWINMGGPMPFPNSSSDHMPGANGASAHASANGMGQIMQMQMMPDPSWMPDPMNPWMPPQMIPMPVSMGMYDSHAMADAMANLWPTGGSQLGMSLDAMTNTMSSGSYWGFPGFYGDVHAEAHASGSVDFNFVGSAHGLVAMDVQTAGQMGYFNIADLSGGTIVSQMGPVILSASHTYRMTGDVMATSMMGGGMGMGGHLSVTLSVHDLPPTGGGGGVGTPTDPFMPWQFTPPELPGQPPMPPMPPEWLFPGRPIEDTGPGRDAFMFFDPDYATGYFIEVSASSPKIAQVILPDCGDGLYNLYSVDADGNKTLLEANLAAGTPYSLTNAAYKVFVDGIEESAMLDMTDPMAFQVGLIFDGPGTAEVTMTPVPEFSTLTLLGVGAIGFLGWAWRRRRAT